GNAARARPLLPGRRLNSMPPTTLSNLTIAAETGLEALRLMGLGAVIPLSTLLHNPTSLTKTPRFDPPPVIVAPSLEKQLTILSRADASVTENKPNESTGTASPIDSSRVLSTGNSATYRILEHLVYLKHVSSEGNPPLISHDTAKKAR